MTNKVYLIILISQGTSLSLLSIWAIIYLSAIQQEPLLGLLHLMAELLTFKVALLC
jgi:hypothetical protein